MDHRNVDLLDNHYWHAFNARQRTTRLMAECVSRQEPISDDLLRDSLGNYRALECARFYLDQMEQAAYHAEYIASLRVELEHCSDSARYREIKQELEHNA